MKKKIYGNINRRFGPAFVAIGLFFAAFAGLGWHLAPVLWFILLPAVVLFGGFAIFGAIVWIFADYI